MFRKNKNRTTGYVTGAGEFAHPAEATPSTSVDLLADLHEVLTDIRDDLRAIRDHLEDDRQLSEIATTLDAVRNHLDDRADNLIGQE